MSRTPWRSLAPSAVATLLVALAVRTIYLLQLRGSPEFLHPVLDAAAHL
jgi:hypothetical protein